MPKHPLQFRWPRLMKEKTAGEYIERSQSWLRNVRYEDAERVSCGDPPRGPKYIKQGRSVRYPIEFLDEWIDRFKEGAAAGWEDDDSNISGLSYQKAANRRDSALSTPSREGMEVESEYGDEVDHDVES